MTRPVTRASVMRLAPPFRLQWEDAQNAFVLLYPEGMVSLNATAGAILDHCDGARPVGEIVGEMQARYPGAEIENDVLDFFRVALDKGWIRDE
ncbi:MAG: pyrroloquinoline quinone biosynthesis peptide chaperone PqqD [Myxococcales bacterium]|nr:MAG: pyrroloquinoline quinone biosynthesis peptide chaperone PqqD [Myxococcales bacterium]